MKNRLGTRKHIQRNRSGAELKILDCKTCKKSIDLRCSNKKCHIRKWRFLRNGLLYKPVVNAAFRDFDVIYGAELFFDIFYLKQNKTFRYIVQSREYFVLESFYISSHHKKGTIANIDCKVDWMVC